MLDLMAAFVAGVDLGVRLANLQGYNYIVQIHFVYPP